MKLIRQINIPMLRYVRISEKRQKKYYILQPEKPTPILPLYLQDTAKYEYKPIKVGKNIKQMLCAVTGERVIKNPKAQGTPKDIRINFQKIWNNEISDYTRNKIAIELKASYKESLSKVDPITEGFPLLTHFTVFSKDEEQDVDNLTILFVKTFHDALVDHKILPDDKRAYIKRYSAGHEEAETDYIIVKIYSYDIQKGAETICSNQN